MTTDEAKRIYDRLFVAYPHLRKYVTDLDQHAQATFDAWKQMLSDVPHDLADECVTRAISGVLDVPAKPWDVALLPGWIRQQVGRMQAARRNAAKVHGTICTTEARLTRRRIGRLLRCWSLKMQTRNNRHRYPM
jgi:hypothetical protein